MYCKHVARIRDVVPSALGCEECLKLGEPWLHLRVCRTCGHVGCCDQSPNRHATKHFRATKHPIIEAYDPPEGWSWCFVDEVMFIFRTARRCMWVPFPNITEASPPSLRQQSTDVIDADRPRHTSPRCRRGHSEIRTAAQGNDRGGTSPSSMYWLPWPITLTLRCKARRNPPLDAYPRAACGATQHDAAHVRR